MDSGSSSIQEKGDVHVEKADREKNDKSAPQLFIAGYGHGGSIPAAGFTMTKREN
jgi:hypothetical protein